MRRQNADYKQFPQYNRLHSKETKMYSGVIGHTLYPMKETSKYYVSLAVWASCASNCRVKKPGGLSVNIPLLTDAAAIKFLEEHCWKDWTTKHAEDSDTREAVELLRKLFPEKASVYFYELDSVIKAYYNGTFISYSENGQIEEPHTRHIEMRKYYTHKYYRWVAETEDSDTKAAYEAYRAVKEEGKHKEKLFETYHKLSEEYTYAHYNLDSVFIQLGQHCVCYPVYFSDNTAEWSKEKYGKLVGYAHSGEIFFIATADKVYFQISRHF